MTLTIQAAIAVSPPVRKEVHQDPRRRIQAAAVRHLCGDISDMSLWRWLNNPELNFPQPIYIGRRRYWREADVIEWLDAQPEAVEMIENNTVVHRHNRGTEITKLET